MNINDIFERNKGRQFEYMRKRKPMSLRNAITSANSRGKKGLIAEYKRRSPSGFRTDEDITSYLSYVTSHRISALSVLSEPTLFNGSFDDIVLAQNYGLPVLVKDFTPDPEFVESAYNAGGDAVLIILDYTEACEVNRILRKAADLGMDAIEEYHEPQALKRFVRYDNAILGYNRRDLKTLSMSSENMHTEYDVSILESGINMHNVESIDRSYSGYLIGTSILTRDGTLEYLESNGII